MANYVRMKHAKMYSLTEGFTIGTSLNKKHDTNGEIFSIVYKS